MTMRSISGMDKLVCSTFQSNGALSEASFLLNRGENEQNTKS